MYEKCVRSEKLKIVQTNWLCVETGLGQESVLFPIHFIIVMDEIHKCLKQKTVSKKKKALLFSGDMVVLGEDEIEVQEQIIVCN